MATYNITTAGNTNPSSATRGYKGYVSTVVSFGGTFTSSGEYTTGEYTAASADDTSYVENHATNAYIAQKIEFYIPSNLHSATISRIDIGTIAYGFDGYSFGGYYLHIRNHGNNTWEQLNVTSTSSYTSLTGFKSSDISNYIDANYRIHILVSSRVAFDSNGSNPSMDVDYAYATLTYTGGDTVAPYIPQIIWFN